ncbi:SAM hydrolase/SAM-dependent halogenase family protein [Geoglobus ahangari]
MVIALLTDFGDYYPGVMKGVIRRISGAEVVDITHSVKPQNVLEGAFLLYNAYRFFPRDTVFVAVVDPGVGGRRKALAIRTENYWFVCPDNGIAYPSSSEDGVVEVYRINEAVSELVGELSSTFHGRDIFAPAGALLKEGRLEERYFSPHTDAIVELDLFDLTISESGVRAMVVHIDRFGNVVTNVRRELVERMSPEGVVFNGLEIPLVERYEDVEVGEPLALIGSFNTLELSIREGDFASEFGVGFGPISLRWIR